MLGSYNSTNQFNTYCFWTRANGTKVNQIFPMQEVRWQTDYKVRESTEGATGTGIILDYAQTARAVPPNIENSIQTDGLVPLVLILLLQETGPQVQCLSMKLQSFCCSTS
jgi:hypothetical protein